MPEYNRLATKLGIDRSHLVPRYGSNLTQDAVRLRRNTSIGGEVLIRYAIAPAEDRAKHDIPWFIGGVNARAANSDAFVFVPYFFSVDGVLVNIATELQAVAVNADLTLTFLRQVNDPTSVIAVLETLFVLQGTIGAVEQLDDRAFFTLTAASWDGADNVALQRYELEGALVRVEVDGKPIPDLSIGETFEFWCELSDLATDANFVQITADGTLRTEPLVNIRLRARYDARLEQPGRLLFEGQQYEIQSLTREDDRSVLIAASRILQVIR